MVGQATGQSTFRLENEYRVDSAEVLPRQVYDGYEASRSRRSRLLLEAQHYGIAPPAAPSQPPQDPSAHAKQGPPPVSRAGLSKERADRILEGTSSDHLVTKFQPEVVHTVHGHQEKAAEPGTRRDSALVTEASYYRQSPSSETRSLAALHLEREYEERERELKKAQRERADEVLREEESRLVRERSLDRFDRTHSNKELEERIAAQRIVNELERVKQSAENTRASLEPGLYSSSLAPSLGVEPGSAARLGYAWLDQVGEARPRPLYPVRDYPPSSAGTQLPLAEAAPPTQIEGCEGPVVAKPYLVPKPEETIAYLPSRIQQEKKDKSKRSRSSSAQRRSIESRARIARERTYTRGRQRKQQNAPVLDPSSDYAPHRVLDTEAEPHTIGKWSWPTLVDESDPDGTLLRLKNREETLKKEDDRLQDLEYFKEKELREIRERIVEFSDQQRRSIELDESPYLDNLLQMEETLEEEKMAARSKRLRITQERTALMSKILEYDQKLHHILQDQRDFDRYQQSRAAQRDMIQRERQLVSEEEHLADLESRLIDSLNQHHYGTTMLSPEELRTLEDKLIDCSKDRLNVREQRISLSQRRISMLQETAEEDNRRITAQIERNSAGTNAIANLDFTKLNQEATAELKRMCDMVDRTYSVEDVYATIERTEYLQRVVLPSHFIPSSPQEEYLEARWCTLLDAITKFCSHLREEQVNSPVVSEYASYVRKNILKDQKAKLRTAMQSGAFKMSSFKKVTVDENMVRSLKVGAYFDSQMYSMLGDAAGSIVPRYFRLSDDSRQLHYCEGTAGTPLPSKIKCSEPIKMGSVVRVVFEERVSRKLQKGALSKFISSLSGKKETERRVYAITLYSSQHMLLELMTANRELATVWSQGLHHLTKVDLSSYADMGQSEKLRRTALKMSRETRDVDSEVISTPLDLAAAQALQRVARSHLARRQSAADMEISEKDSRAGPSDALGESLNTVAIEKKLIAGFSDVNNDSRSVRPLAEIQKDIATRRASLMTENDLSHQEIRLIADRVRKMVVTKKN